MEPFEERVLNYLTENRGTQFTVYQVANAVGTASAGIYSIAARLVTLIDIGLTVTNLASAHHSSELKSLGQTEKLQKIVSLTSKIAFLSTFPVILALYLGAEKIMLFFGKPFIGGLPIVRVMLIGEMVTVATGPNGLLLSMTDHHREMVWIFLFSFIIDISMILALSSIWGIIGVAGATALSLMIRNLITVSRVWRLLRINSTIFSLKIW